MDIKNVIAQNVKRYRKEAGLTQLKASEITGISHIYWNYIEKQRALPSIVILQRMCNTIQVPISKVFEENTGL